MQRGTLFPPKPAIAFKVAEYQAFVAEQKSSNEACLEPYINQLEAKAAASQTTVNYDEFFHHYFLN